MMATNLDPQLLQQILALMQGQGATNNGTTQWTGPQGSDLAGYQVSRAQDPGSYSGTDYTPGDYRTLIYGPQSGGTWGTQSNDVFDTQGNFVDTSSGDSTAMQLAKFIAMSVGGYYGAGALNGAEGAAMGGAEAGGLGGWDAAMADAAASGSISGTGAGTLAGGGAAAAGAGAAGTGSTLASGAKTAADLLGGGKGVAALVGGVAGALDSGDKEQTTSRDPWAPAQPYLKGLLAEGSDLYGQMKAEPFSQSQQAGYTNIGSLLDLVNNNAGGLLAGPQANASGRNQFVRGRQQGLLGSTFEPTAEQWRPQQFGDMGMTKYRGGR